MNVKRILCLMLSLVMLLGMTVSASAEITGDINCYHQWAWSWPQGKPANCQDWKPSQEYCVKCGALGGYYDQCGSCVAGSKQWIRPQGSNCQEYGVWEITCKYCGEWLSGGEEPGPHKWATYTHEQPTCEYPGSEETLCSVCGDEKGDWHEIPALGHNWGEWHWAHEQPSCNTGAWQVRECKRCGRMEDRWVEGGNHNWGEWKVYEAPTCLEKGIEHRLCSICGDYWTRELEALGHEMGEWTIIKQPAAGENGLKERKCVRCEYTEQEEIPYTGGEIEYAFASLTKREASAPANGECYTLGETVLYSVIFTVPEGLTLLDVEITDPIKGNNEDAVLDILPEADGGEYTYSVSHVVTETDIENGFVSNIATAYFFDPEGDAWVSVSSNEVKVLTGEDDNSAVILEKIDMRGPANGEYYVPGETIKYGLTVRSDENNPLENIVIYDPLKGGDQIVFGPADSWVLGAGFDYTVTEADAQRGYIENTGYATFTYQNTGKEDTVYSNTLILPCGTAEASYITAIDLELVGLPAAENVKPGDVLKVKLKATNTGEMTVTMNSSGRVAANGDWFDDAGIMNWNKYQSDPLSSWFMAGNSLTSDLDITVTESHIADGEIRFTFIQYAEPIYVVVNGVETDIPADIVPTPEGTTGRYGKDEEEVSDSVEIVIPLTNGSDDQKNSNFTKHVSNTPANGEFFVPGEEIRFWLSFNILDSEGNINEEDGVYDIRFYDPLIHGQNIVRWDTKRIYSWDFHVYYTVTEEDAQRGYVENTAYVTFSYTEGGETVRLDSNTVTAPCGPGELPDDYVPPVNPDIDEDGIPNEEDPDMDGDGIPNGEDPDVDGDGTPNGSDPDVDGDGIPNGNDPDADGDGTPNGDDPDVDGDGTPNGSDPDVDGDGTPNGDDSDVDGDGVPNGGDPDIDGDGIPNEEDPDMDGDGIANEDDPDADGDGIPDEDGDFGLSDCLTLVKTLLSTPANGNYFVPGEEVEYSVLVKNTGDALTGLVVSDWMWDAPRSFGDIQKGEDVTYPVNYTVTDADARAQHVNNIAQAEAVDMNGNSVYEYSNLVSIPCGFPDLDSDGKGDDPFGILSGLEVTKTVESLPLNGSYYTEGETVAYRITYTNTGELPLTDVEIFDPLFGLGGMASAEMLTPGESRYCFFDYVITGEDVARGYVYNQAIAVYMINDITATAYSNSVIVDTDGSVDTNPYLDWVYGELIPPADGEPIVGEVDLETLYASGVCCSRTITYKDGASATYETAFCPKHLGAKASASMMMKAAITPEMQIQAASYASAIFRGEVEKMYQELISACDPVAKATVMAEYIGYQTELANYEALLKMADPEHPEAAAVKISEMWEEKCVTMCIELHTAADARKDSLSDIALSAGNPASACECVIVSDENGKKAVTETYCPVHAFPFSMTDALLAVNDPSEAWTLARQIWNIELTNAYNKMSEKTGVNKALVITEFQMLNQWMTAREAQLYALYPNEPEIVLETMVKIIMDRVSELCE